MPSGQPEVVRALISDLRSEIATQDADLLGRYPVEQYGDYLSRTPASKSYTFLGAEVRRVAEAVAHRVGAAILGRYHKLLLAHHVVNDTRA